MTRSYERLPIEKFGAHLLETNDLDPIYVALKNANMGEEHLKRWLVAYWCFYHAGVASYISDAGGVEFWERFYTAAQNTLPAPDGGRWPRGKERRHFRGKAALDTTIKLRAIFPREPEKMVDDIIGADQEENRKFSDVANRAKKYPLFGPWISFKVCDMLERVLGVKIDFSQASVFIFTDPLKAAIMLWRIRNGLSDEAKPADQDKAVAEVVSYLEKVFEDYRAPPDEDRPIGLQEIETILCKWKSHMNGHYPLNNDLIEIEQSLKGWTLFSKTAEKILQVMPRSINGIQ